MDRQQMLKVLVPVGGLALLLVLVGGVIALSNMPDSTPTVGQKSEAPASTTPMVEGHSNHMHTPPSAAPKMDFPLDGQDWKDVDAATFPGLKYWDVKEGTGPACPNLKAQPSIVPVMHYTGWLTTGFQFDSSMTKGEPLTYPLNQLVRGWQEGVPGMKVGGKRRLIVPPQFGYGQRAQNGIPANSILVFEMELLGIK